ncbi:MULTISPECIES: pilus assembly protein N-terminal domain-containing protein [Rhodomicrobium]|uniref:pilus assembly protein N-terminal domain-containing protein n=1 Tax=Rhodomicrobium TaxID=1068 RepID=UPI001481DF45|nr:MULTISPECIES: pilus assembly protein N-terminal domain-containing protein [Rhodomicrobium]
MVRLGRIFAVLLMLSAGESLSSLAAEMAALDVSIDEARLIRLEADAAQIIVGNPAIADVAVQNPRLLVVTGKSYGATNLIALDGAGQEILAARFGVREGDARQVTVYKGTVRQSLHCAPDCQRVLSLGDDKAQFDAPAETVAKKFGVVNSAIGGN